MFQNASIASPDLLLVDALKAVSNLPFCNPLAAPRQPLPQSTLQLPLRYPGKQTAGPSERGTQAYAAHATMAAAAAAAAALTEAPRQQNQQGGANSVPSLEPVSTGSSVANAAAAIKALCESNLTSGAAADASKPSNPAYTSSTQHSQPPSTAEATGNHTTDMSDGGLTDIDSSSEFTQSKHERNDKLNRGCSVLFVGHSLTLSCPWNSPRTSHRPRCTARGFHEFRDSTERIWR